MKKLLALILAITFAYGVISGAQMVKADGTSNTNGGTGTNPGVNTGGTNSCGPNCTRMSWGQLKVKYLDAVEIVDVKNAE